MAILQSVDNDDNYQTNRPTHKLQSILKYIESIQQKEPLAVFEKIVSMLGMCFFFLFFF